VIVGRLIPAGTGAYVNQLKKMASSRDKLAVAAQQQSAAESTAIEADHDVIEVLELKSGT
jgi:hypothetical protein